MKYISSNGLEAPLVAESPLRISALRRSRGAPGVDGAALDLDQSIDSRICQPRLLQSDDSLCLFVAGFRIRLAEPVGLSWARLRLLATPNDHAIASFFPRSVVRPQAFVGRFAVGKHGEIERDAVDVAVEGGRSTSRYEPMLSAGYAGQNGVFWDFLPWNRRVPTGCDQLIFTTHAAGSSLPDFEARLMLAVVVTDAEGEIYLDLPPARLRAEIT